MKVSRVFRNHLFILVTIFFTFALSGCGPDAPPIENMLAMEARTGDMDKGSAGSKGYLLKPGDKIEIRVWKEPDLSGERLVRKDGYVTLPLIGDVQAAGKTTSEFSELVRTELKKYIEYPEVSVALLSTQATRVYVMGEVNAPGEYELNEGARVIQAITKAGGFTEWAKKSKLILIRRMQGKEMRFKVNYDAIVSGKDSKQNVILKDGDIIVAQ